MHKDATGRELAVGSYVAYVVTTGSGSGVKFGVVAKLKEDSGEQNTYDGKTKSWSMQPYTKHSISIVSAEQRRRWDAAADTYVSEWTLQGKVEGKFARVIHVERMERVILLNPDQMHQEAKELLDLEMKERGM